MLLSTATTGSLKGPMPMVERRSELRRRQQRRKKMFKLKAKLAKAKEGRDKDNILKKIHLISPAWKPAAAAKT
jgi:hypothetical protein